LKKTNSFGVLIINSSLFKPNKLSSFPPHINTLLSSVKHIELPLPPEIFLIFLSEKKLTFVGLNILLFSFPSKEDVPIPNCHLVFNPHALIT